MPVSQDGLSMLEKYVLTCLFFICGALLEYCFIMVSVRLTEEFKSNEIAKDMMTRLYLKKQCGHGGQIINGSTKNATPLHKRMHQAEAKIDLLTMITYFMAFIIFNIWYWVEAWSIYEKQINHCDNFQ